MDLTALQKEIDIKLNSLLEKFRNLASMPVQDSAIQMQEISSEIKELYAKSLEFQHSLSVHSMEELEASIAAKHASMPKPATAQPVHIDSLIPKSSTSSPELKESVQEVMNVVEQIITPKPVSSHPSMDDLLIAAANKAAEANHSQESQRRKKVITDIHDKFDPVPTLAGKFNGQESLGQRMAGTKSQTAVAEKHQRKAITNLKIAIGTNEKFLFINHLFSGNTQEYNSSIDQINNSPDLETAKTYIHQTLINKYDWDINTQPANIFIDLVERRFIS